MKDPASEHLGAGLFFGGTDHDRGQHRLCVKY